MNFQNIVVRGKDNPVAIKFYFRGEFAELGLNNFSRIVVNIDSETYDSDLTNKVAIIAADELRLRIGYVTSLAAGEYQATITGYSTTYNDGYELTSPNNPLLGEIIVVD